MGAKTPGPQAIYSPRNVKVAYQLDWSLTLFWRTPAWTDDWVPTLQKSLEPDRIRLLKHRFLEPGVSLFLITTQPDVMPIDIPHRVKGRLYHILRDHFPQPFQRNYDLHSIGSTTRTKLEDYLTGQLEHHPESDRKFHWVLSDMQVIRPEMDLSEPRFTSHGRFSSNLHLVLVRDWRKRETDREMLEKIRRMVIRAAEAKQHRLSHVAILPDHLHLLLGIRLEESPLAVGLSYLNNIAYVYGMRPILQHSFFVGTFGEYDLGAIQ